MNIETKKVKNPEPYKAFGWNVVVEDDLSNEILYVIERDKDIPNYNKINELENKYFELEASREIYEPAKWYLIVFSVVFLLVPFFIYLYIKFKERKNIAKLNEKIDLNQATILLQVKQLLKSKD